MNPDSLILGLLTEKQAECVTLRGRVEELTGKLRVAEARLAEREPDKDDGEGEGDQPAVSPNGSTPQPVVA